MTTKRTADLLTEAFSDVMSNRRKYELETPNGTKIDLYFPPLTRYDRQKAQVAAGTDDALIVSTQLLCQIAEKEDGTLGVKYEKLIGLLVQAINELSAKVKK